MGRASGTPPALVLRCAAVLTAACVLAACSGGSRTGGGGAGAGGSGSAGGAGRRPGSGAAISRPGFGRSFIAVGAGGGPQAVIAIGGLPGGGRGGRPAISVPPIPQAGSTRPIPMPLDSYEQVAGNEQEVLVEASNLLTQRCMAARGFGYTQTTQASAELSALQATEDSPVGITSLSQAQAYGYGTPQGSTGRPGFFGTVSAQAFGTALRDHGQAWVTALLGFSPGPPGRQAQGRQEGCIQQVTSELYGPGRGSSNPDPVPGIAFQAVAWTQSDPRILAVDKARSGCMARQGLRYRTPQAAAQHHWPSVPSPVEIATAVADVTCKTQVNLTNTWLTVEAAYQLALISQDLTALSQLQSSFKALQQRAERLMGAGRQRASR